MGGSSWSLGLVEPVIAFFTGLFFGYQIWATKKPSKASKGDSRTLNLEDDQEVGK